MKRGRGPKHVASNFHELTCLFTCSLVNFGFHQNARSFMAPTICDSGAIIIDTNGTMTTATSVPFVPNTFVQSPFLAMVMPLSSASTQGPGSPFWICMICFGMQEANSLLVVLVFVVEG